MKNTKKLASVVLALVLVFAMSIPAFAATTGSIIIENAVENETYEIYKMLDFTPANEAGTAGIYKVATGWEDFFKTGAGATYFDVASADGVVTLKDGVEEADYPAIAKAAIDYADEKGIEATNSAKATGTTVEFTGLDLGYYAIDTTLGTICALTNTNSDFTATEKNEVPTIEKEVQEDSDGTWGEWNDADIGQKVNYKATITVKKGAVDYTMHDKMEAGLTFNNDVVVTVAGATVDAANYTVKTADLGDDCTFHVDFNNDYIATLAPETEIEVTYSATLNKGAEIVTETNDNETWLEYGESNNTTSSDITKTLTYYFNLDKVDEKGNALDGAEFTLALKSSPDTLISFVKTADGYRVATAEDTDTTTTITVGSAKIEGLDADTYLLTETKAPEGYNLLAEAIEVVVDEATVEGENVTFVPVDKDVVNKTGSLLPETGGMGTTLFYMLGGLLVVGAAMLLVTKKRMAYEA